MVRDQQPDPALVPPSMLAGTELVWDREDSAVARRRRWGRVRLGGGEGGRRGLGRARSDITLHRSNSGCTGPLNREGVAETKPEEEERSEAEPAPAARYIVSKFI